MPKIRYTYPPAQRRDTLAIVALAEQICSDYSDRGYSLTLRQLYYQFISRDFFPNSEKSYDKLGRIVSDARLFGQVDWFHITDRGREAVIWGGRTGDDDEMISRFLDGISRSFTQDLHVGQSNYCEVWVEKDALSEVISRAANPYRVGSFACKGYVSQSAMWEASQRFAAKMQDNPDLRATIFHFGDHDPSGIDMTRDIRERMGLFLRRHVDNADERFEVKRVALTMDQIDQYQPPPNPAKLSDSRASDYVAQYGYESWELDALPPDVLAALVRDSIESVIDLDLFNAERERERANEDKIDAISRNWPEVSELLDQLEN